MAFTQGMLEEVAAWCRDSMELTAPRREARARFFGDEDDRPVKYWAGTEDFTAKERRFLGYFLFDCALPTGEKPAEVAAKRLYLGSAQAEALTAISKARFVFAEIKSIVGREVTLGLEEERFRVRSAQWAASVQRDSVIVAHLVPVRSGYWLAAPGWVNMPFTLGPGLRANLAMMQTDPISLERMLQGRASPAGELPAPPPPTDADLDTAVNRLSAWAAEHGYDALVMSPTEWEALVVKHLTNPALTAFYQEVMARIDAFSSEEEVSEFGGLLTNIWNNTPQPDRGGLTANQMAKQGSGGLGFNTVQ